MKLISVLGAIVILAFATSVWGASLVCDPQQGVVSYNVDVDGVITTGVIAETDGSILYNIDYLPQGQHTFKLQAIGSGDWPSDWSDPLDATKPGSPGNVRVAN